MTRAIPTPLPESTDLERRVLAHEKVLQALIAYMARTEPRFIDHLREQFVEPMRMVPHEQDYRETDDYAEEFIRTVMLLGKTRPPRPKQAAEADGRRQSPKTQEEEGPVLHRPVSSDRVLVCERNGIWEVKVDGKFRGDYHQEEQAFSAAALLELSL